VLARSALPCGWCLVGEEQLNLDGSVDPTVALCQYDTPPALARVQARLAIHSIPAGWWRRSPYILEPSAGVGTLVRALRAESPLASIDAVELDPSRVAALHELADPLTAVCPGDYLARRAPKERYDVTCSNPPFTAGVECEHIAKMMDESERLCLQIPIRSLHGKRRTAELWSRVGKEWWLRAEIRVAERVYPNASDDIVVCLFTREPGPCDVAWWAP
jgi:predicted RNA methylase